MIDGKTDKPKGWDHVMTRIEYIRRSTTEQNLKFQLDELK